MYVSDFIMKKMIDDCNVYYYHKQFMIDQPKETRVVNRYYDNDYGWVAVLKHKSILIEIICVMIIILNIILLWLYPMFSVKIYIPKHFNLYNNNLYTNIVSDERNKVDIKCTILSNDYTIEPGDRLYTVKSERELDSVDLTISYKILLFEKRQSYTIPVYTVY